jgi:hypothetical protein
LKALGHSDDEGYSAQAGVVGATVEMDDKAISGEVDAADSLHELAVEFFR